MLLPANKPPSSKEENDDFVESAEWTIAGLSDGGYVLRIERRVVDQYGVEQSRTIVEFDIADLPPASFDMD